MRPILKQSWPSVALFLITLPVTAHHSPAIYDQERDIRLEGVVTKFEWVAPHVYIQLETENDAEGKIVWTIEARPPSPMSRLGWSRRSLEPGERVTVAANPARNANRKVALGQSVLKEDGTLLSILSISTEGDAGASPTSFVADDVSGNWETRSGRDVLLPFKQPQTSWSLTDRGLAAVESYDERFMNPNNDCVPELAPQAMIYPGVKSIEIGEEVTVIRLDESLRMVYMNLDSHDGTPYTQQGHSIGWWEDDVFVVDTVHSSEHRIGNAWGLPSSRQKHLIERFELSPDQSGLTYTFWVEDPEYLAEPMMGTLDLRYRPDLPFVSLPCNPEIARRYIEE